MQRLFLYISCIIGSSFQFPPARTTTVSGIVMDARYRTPVSDAHTYVVRGEEEGLTSSSGRFSFTITESDHLMLVVQHPEYEPMHLPIKRFDGNTILLTPLRK